MLFLKVFHRFFVPTIDYTLLCIVTLAGGRGGRGGFFAILSDFPLFFHSLEGWS